VTANESMSRSPTIREAEQRDLPAIVAIYNDVIAQTTAVYSESPVPLAERESWWRDRRGRGYPVLVAEDRGEVVAFASFGEFRAWPCYRYTVEHSVHVRADRRGCGIGSTLVRALFPIAASLGKHVLIAGVDAANHGSIAMHEKLGFERVAHLREVGRKFDRWLDLVFLQRIVG